MTSTLSPEYRARLIVEAFKGQTFSEPDDVDRWLQRKITAAIKEATKAEACAYDPVLRFDADYADV